MWGEREVFNSLTKVLSLLECECLSLVAFRQAFLLPFRIDLAGLGVNAMFDVYEMKSESCSCFEAVPACQQTFRATGGRKSVLRWRARKFGPRYSRKAVTSGRSSTSTDLSVAHRHDQDRPQDGIGLGLSASGLVAREACRVSVNDLSRSAYAAGRPLCHARCPPRPSQFLLRDLRLPKWSVVTLRQFSSGA